MKNKKQIIISLLGLLSLLLVTVGVSVAFFDYAKEGSKENTVKLGSITFKYTENENLGNGISISEALPISDEEGKIQLGTGKIFDFEVDANLSRSDIEYEVVAQVTKNSTLPLDAIKFYLTDVSNGLEQPITSTVDLDGNVRTLDSYNDTLIKNATGKTVYQETILKNTKGYLKQFRARMWLREDLDWTDEKYMGKTATIKINVYANSDRSMASTETTSPVDTGVERVMANNRFIFTKEENNEEIKETQYNLTVPNEVSTLNVDVIPTSTEATVEIERIDSLVYDNTLLNQAGMVRNKVARLSTISEQIDAKIKEFDLKVGDNYFKATVTSANKAKKEQYILKVTRDPSNNVGLSSLSVDGFDLTPNYSNNENTYRVQVPYETSTVEVKATKADEVQTITGLGTHELKVGDNTITVVVKAENGSERKIKLIVNRKASADASISNVAVKGYTLTHVADNIYSVTVAYNVDSVEIENVSKTNAIVQGTGVIKNLVAGNNDYEVQVTSQDQSVTNKYIIRIFKQVDTNNALKSLKVTNHTITPSFNKDVLAYSLTVENNVTEIEVVAETESSVATVSGTGNKTLNVGANTVNVEVTAQNGSKRTYAITVTRKASSDATLKSLSVTGYTLSPKFESSEIAYAISVPYNVTTLEVNAAVNNNEAKYTISGNTDLKFGENKVSVVVTAGNGTTKTYTITVTRNKDTDNTLSSLSLTSCTLSPAFASSTTSYACTVENNVTETTVSATTTSSVATVTGVGKQVLNVGTNVIDVVVTAQDGTTKTYKVTVTRKASSDATLKSLSVSGYTISPAFDSNTTSYTLTVPYSVTSIIVNAAVNNGEASYKVSGNTDFKVGENTVTVVVTAGDKTTKTYTITVTRSQDTNNALKNLKVTNHTITPSFNKDVLAYSLTVENNVTEIEVVAETESSVATVSGTGNKTLNVGVNTVNVEVTAQNGSKRTYAITVTRKASSDATLKSLSVTGYTLSPKFESSEIAYAISVPYNVTSVEVNAAVNNNEAKYTISGNTDLKFGENKVSVVVTAGNGTTKTYTITVTRNKDTDNTLSSLSLTSCTLSPAFASSTTSYTCTVENNVTETTVSATTTSSVATVTGVGKQVLNVGTNVIDVVVTAQDGTTKTYKVTVTRKASSDATLKSLSVSGYTISPAFDSNTTSYTLIVPYSVTSITVNAAVNNGEASYKVSGNTDFKVGENTVTVVVTAGDKTTKTYTITVTRSKDTVSTLKSLSLTSCTLSPTFAAGTTSYGCTVENSVTSTTVSAQATSSVATVSGTGSKSLNVGANTIDVVVTAQDGTTKTTYKVVVTRKASSDATLKSLSVSGYNISPAFDSNTTSYTLAVPYSVSSLTVNAAVNNSEASYKVSGNTSLVVGSNTVTVTVTAGNGTTKTYTITVTRNKDTDNTLSSLSLTSCTLSPTFAAGTTSYSCTVENSVTSTTVSALATSGVATVSGTGNYPLAVGTNTIAVNVTSQSGELKTYKVVVTRKASSDATLKSLSVSGYTISPAFDSNTTSYTLTVPYGVTSLTVNAAVNNSEASYAVSGNTSLAVGSNAVKVTVTAGDKTTKTYTITVTRSKDTVSTLKSLSLTSCTLSPTFASGTTSYSCTVENSVTSTTVSAQATSSVATVSGTGSKSLNVGANTIDVVVTAQDGTTKTTYKVVVTRKPNSDATLKSLGVTGQTLSPSFNNDTTAYTLSVPYSTDSITITGSATASVSTVTGLGSKTLSVGENKFSITVTAEDKNTTKTYEITVTRREDTTTSLKSISVEGYNIVKVDNNHYTLTVANNVTSVVVKAEASSNVAIVTGTGTKTLTVGNNTAKVTVTAQNGDTEVYEIAITRQASSDANLKSLSVSGYTISPTFASGTTSYTLTVPNSVTSLTVNAAVNNSEASYAVSGNTSLSVGSNAVKVTVTAGDKTTKTYTITVKRMGKDTITLSAKSAAYTGSAIAANTATATSGSSITYTYYSSTNCSGTALSGAPTNAGNYSVKAVSAGNSDYESGSKCVTHTITQIDNTLTVSAKSGLTYTGSAQSLVTAASAQGTVYYSVGTQLTSSNYSSSGSTTIPSKTDAGTYTVYYYTPGNTNYKAKNGNVSVTIAKKADTITLTAVSKTYTGSAFAATASATSGTTVTLTYYSDSSCATQTTTSNASAAGGTPKTVGTYYAKATSAGNTNYNAGSLGCTKAVTITQATNTLTVSAKSGLSYTGSAQSLVTAASAQGTVYYSVGTQLTSSNYSTSGSTTIPTRTDAGTYTVYYYTPGNTNYSAKNGNVSVTISQINNTLTVSAKSGLTYTGSAQSLVTAASAQGTVYYSVGTQLTSSNYSTSGSTTVPTKTDAGTYTVYYYTPGNTNYKAKSGNVSVTIAKKADAITLTAVSKTYTGSAFAATASATSGTTVTLTYYSDSSCATQTTTSNASAAGGTPKTVGTYYAKATSAGNTNYNAGSLGCTKAVTITQATNTLTVSAKSGLTYNGSAQSLVTVASAQGTVYYSVGTELTSSNYSSKGSTTVPTTTAAGTYTVYYYTPGNTNYSAKSGNVSVTIAKKSVAVTWGSTTSFAYTGSAQAPTASVSTGISSETMTVTRTTQTNAGSYTSTASCSSVSGGQASCNNYTLTSTTKAFTITQINNTLTVSAKSGLTYNGSAQSLVTAASAQGTVYYSVGTQLTSSNYSSSGSTTVPTKTAAGTYTVYYYTPGNTNYKAKDGNVSVTIAKKSVAVTWGSTTSFAYTGSAQAPTASVSTGISSETMTVTRTTQTNAGSYTSTASCSSVSGGQASCNNYTLTSTTKAFTITQINNTLTVSAKSGLTYTGSAQSLVTAASAQGTVYYSVGTQLTSSNYSSSGSTTIPSKTAAGTYTVYYYTPGNTNYKAKDGNVSVTIAKKSVAVTWGSTTSFAYTGSAQAPTASVTTGISAETMTVTRTTGTNAGSYTSTASCSSVSGGGASCNNYTLTSTTKAFTITQINNTLTVSAKSGLTYTGSAQSLVTAASAQGSVYYSVGTQLTSSNYSSSGSTTIPSKTDAGTYTVYYYTPGNTNYKATNGSVSVTISKKADTVSISAKSTTYTGSAIAANTASATSGTSISYTYYSSTDCSGSALSSAPTNVGNYSVKATSAGNTNYSAGSKCVTHTITKGTPTISLSAKTAEATGSGIAANTATAKNPNGSAVSLTYTYTYYTDSSCSSGATTTAPSAYGTYYVKATSGASTNLNSASSSCTKHTINKNTNTNLGSLSITGWTISPSFSASTTQYTATVEAAKVTVNATAATSLSTVTGTGSKNLVWGSNTLSVIVTSQSGNTKTYVITVTNERPVAPTVSLMEGEWSTYDVIFASSGSALSGLNTYEYYISSSSTAPTNATLANGQESRGTNATGPISTASGAGVRINAEGISYVWVRSVSNNGFRSVWSGPKTIQIVSQASSVGYDDSESGLGCDTVQCAIDKLDQMLSR